VKALPEHGRAAKLGNRETAGYEVPATGVHGHGILRPLRITIFADIADTVTRDLHRATKVFSPLPIKFTAQRFTLTRAATRAILGTDGKLSVKGGPTAFEHTRPGTQDTVSVSDPDGNFTSEVWDAIRDWTNFGGIRVFYVKEFPNATRVPSSATRSS
jgi:hypothetical protein